MLYVHSDAWGEFDYLANRNRSTAYAAGELFRVLDEIARDGLADWYAPLYTENGYQIYMFSFGSLNMFVAGYGQTQLLVHFSELGIEGDQLPPPPAIDRMREYFGI